MHQGQARVCGAHATRILTGPVGIADHTRVHGEPERTEKGGGQGQWTSAPRVRQLRGAKGSGVCQD